MVSVDEINRFALTATDPVLSALLAEICKRIEALESRNEILAHQNQTLKDRALELGTENKDLRNRVNELELTQDKLIDKINEHAENINTVWKLTKRPPAPKGQKTLQRLEKLDQILKERGPRTLGQLGEELKLSSSEISRLIGKLDKRRYEVSKRPGNEREKVIRLRSRLN